jgi:UDP-2,3-diacylglucosamine hydrolase
VTHLVHGHTHRPAVHRLEVAGEPAVRIVLGDWYEQDSLLAWGPGGFRLGRLEEVLGRT